MESNNIDKESKMTSTEKLKRIAKILKLRFPNLTTDETIDLAVKILDSLDQIN